MRNKMTTRKIHSSLALFFVAVLAAWGCESREERAPHGPPLEISLALARFPYSGLIAIAEEKGFFKQSGLTLSTKEYAYGFETLEAVSRGDAQLAMCNELLFAVKINDHPSLRVVASIGLANTNEIVARKDRHIHEPSELKGKRIGFCPNTSSEYYLDTFLLAHIIASSEVTTVAIPPARAIEAIVGGEVDAMSMWDTDVYHTKARMGENAVSWKSQNNQDWHWILVTRADLLQAPESTKRFLKALVKAENFLLTHEEEAKNIITQNWGFDPEFVRQIWDRTRLQVSLDQSLIVSLENFAKWNMRRDGKAGDLPDFLNYIYVDALDEIDRRAVTIFR
jgi:NitT/TauT family transport system substrate-binding protein